MWGTLKKDFGEFVSTVATDATDALQQLDEGLESGQSGGDGEGLTLIDPDTGIPIVEYNDNDNDDDDIDDDEQQTNHNNNNNNKNGVGPLPLPPTPDEATVDDMKEFLMTYDDVFLDPIITSTSSMDVDDDDVDDGDDKAVAQAFLDTFDIGTKTEDIAALLELHRETLEPTFSRLTDQVEYSDFWKRYFYRIGGNWNDEEQLKANYVQYYEKYMAEVEAAAAKQQNAKTNPQLVAKAALSNMTTFLGGVVHRLVDENDADDSADEDEEIVEDTTTAAINNSNNAAAATTSATNRFGNFLASAAAVRNNTTAAVSNTNADAASQDEDDEDEVELGWDDDDDDDDEEDEDEDDDDDDRNDETVEFKDAQKEKLQEDLALAQEERDMLHKTVTMQSEEIKKLREAVQPAVVLAGADEQDQVKLLQMQLFEKDSELAALRAQLDDMKNDNDEEGEDDANKKLEAEAAVKEMDRLKQVIADKEEQVEALQASQKSNAASTAEVAQEMDRLKEEIAFKDQQILMLQAAAENTDQTSSAEAAIAAAAEARAEIDRLQEIVATKDARLVEEVRVADQQASELRLQLETFQSERERAENLLRSQLEDLQRENETLKLTLSNTAAEDEAMVQKDNQIAALQESLDEARMALESRVPVEDLNEARQELAQSQSTADALRLQLEQTTTMLKEQETELQQQLAKRPSSPGSNSTGVKVVSADAQSQDDSVAAAVADEPPVVQKVPATTSGGGGRGDEDDGWGDDW